MLVAVRSNPAQCKHLRSDLPLGLSKPHRSTQFGIWTCHNSVCVRVGGNLATSVAILSRDRGGAPLALQLLYYPLVDMPDPATYASYKEFSGQFEGDIINTEDVRNLVSQYVPDSSAARDPRFAVIKADLAGLPPAVVLTAEVDPLRDEGKAYANRLRAAGVPTQHKLMQGTMHAFMSFPVPQNAQGMTISVAALQTAFRLQVPSRL